MSSPDHPVLVPLHHQIRLLWRREPSAQGEDRTEILLRLHDLKGRLQKLSLQWRAGLVDDAALRARADVAAGELRRLGAHWA